MEVTIGPEIFLSYKRLSYKIWYALAEFVDNSTQAYLDNKKVLDEIYKKEGTKLNVSIEYGGKNKREFIRISDNSIGMSKQELNHAVIVGKPPKNNKGRSKYGLGLKTGASWLGDYWTVKTKKLNDPYEYSITFDVPRIASNDLDLREKRKKIGLEKHYTIIEIKILHRKSINKNENKIKEYLSSIYRFDIKNGDLKLEWNKEELKWDENSIIERLQKNKTGEPLKREFSFELGGKKVHGWAGVFATGSRKDAGFSIIQSNRVIKGWPNLAYKPELIYGEQEGGRNDLINQRLFGEIHLDGFLVSHTKDEILFELGEEEKLEHKLKEKIGDLIKAAREYRVKDHMSVESTGERNAALNRFELEIKSPSIRDEVEKKEIPNVKVWSEGNNLILKSKTSNANPEMKVSIGDLNISLFLEQNMSPNDPYVIFESTAKKESIVILINLSHPHWKELTNEESILNFLRHSVYDGVAEWKANFVYKNLKPDTIKIIKDSLLRTTFELGD
ncbi:MAG: ATP-binding protein [Ignavibacteriales bacterium]|nr:ATP-binding protein [Ignavibacteriales bacterium]